MKNNRSLFNRSWNSRPVLLAAALLLALSAMNAAYAQSGAIKDPERAQYYQTFKDKWVVYVPVFMGLSLTEGWSKMMQQQADLLGYKYEVRNANFSTAAGTRILTQLINGSPKPDVIVVHNPDVTSYVRLIKKAEKAGIYVVQNNMKSLYMTTGFAGGDATRIGQLQAQAVVDHCTASGAPSQKVLILTGPTTAPWSVYLQEGYDKVLKQNPEIKVVARQSTGNYSSQKAKSITQIILKQHPDLCAVIGVWDIPSLGTASAIKSADMQDQVYLSTNGGQNTFACKAIKSGKFDHYVSFDVPGQGRDLNDLIQMALQLKVDGIEPGTVKTALYSSLVEITPENLKDNPCWNIDTLRY